MSKLDRIEKITQEEKSRALAAFVSVSSGLGMWAFDLDGSLVYTTSVMEEEYFNFFKISGCYEFMLNNLKKLNRPLMLSDELDLVWVAEGMFDEHNDIKIILLMGPLFLSNVEMKRLKEKLSKKVFSVKLMLQMARSLSKVPVVYRNVLSVYMSMLHFAITSEPLADDNIFYQYDSDEDKRLIEESRNNQDYLKTENEIRGEKIILNAIKEGNLNYMQVFDEQIFSNGQFLTDSGDSMRDAKNTMLVFNSLFARTAIEGGLPVSICSRMERDFANGIEECKTLSKLAVYNENMISTYVSKVHAHKMNPQISRAIAESCEYIKANAYKEISIESISSELGYSPYYFAKRFHKELGVKVLDYIKQVRIEYAKIELLSTNKSVDEISDLLHFGTRNYFSRVFKAETGMSPSEFRMGGSKNS